MTQLEGFIDLTRPQRVCLAQFGFQKFQVNVFLFVYKLKKTLALLLVYIDGILTTRNNL